MQKNESKHLNQDVFWTMIPLDLGHRQCRIKEKQVNSRKPHNIADLLVGICTKTRKHWNKKDIEAKKSIFRHFRLPPFSSQRLLECLSCFSREMECYLLRKHVYKFKNKDPSNPSWKLLKVDRPWGYVFLIDLARYVFYAQKMRIVRGHHPQSSFWWSFDGSSNFLGL